MAQIPAIRIVTVPCRRDNFSYLASAEGSTEAIVVDPCEPLAIAAALQRESLRPVAILNTHHHYDHVGGNRDLLRRFPKLSVYGHRVDRGRIPGQTHFLGDHDEFLAAGLPFSVLYLPGHTQGHVAYRCGKSVFVGDVLFGAGCGRLLEGTAEEMYASLQRLAQLPRDSELYFAHEYTESNLRFAAHCEPNNAELSRRQADCATQRHQGLTTSPTTVGLELETNPFLRAGQSSLAEHFGLPVGSPPLEVFTAARRAKDRF